MLLSIPPSRCIAISYLVCDFTMALRCVGLCYITGRLVRGGGGGGGVMDDIRVEKKCK